jgi:integrase
MRDHLISRNVAAGERPRSSRNRDEIKALSSEQARALLIAARGTRNEALYVVALHTGPRQGELLGLKWADVDLASRRISVRRALKVTNHGLDFGPPKNKASRRSVPLSKGAVTALRAHPDAGDSTCPQALVRIIELRLTGLTKCITLA